MQTLHEEVWRFLHKTDPGHFPEEKPPRLIGLEGLAKAQVNIDRVMLESDLDDATYQAIDEAIRVLYAQTALYFFEQGIIQGIKTSEQK